MVPLYGDMQIAPFNYVMRTKNYESSKWPACNSQSESIQGKILDQVDKIRNEHNNYISELAKYSNEVRTLFVYFADNILNLSFRRSIYREKATLHPLSNIQHSIICIYFEEITKKEI